MGDAKAAGRQALLQLPVGTFFELPGRPNVVYELRDYTKDKKAGRQFARVELPFLFRAFETGQAPPPRPGTKKYGQPRAATIHEYLDWTITSEDAEQEDDLDFGGFRVITLLPRYRPGWPPPGAYEEPHRRSFTGLGAPRDPLPQLLIAGKPICAATIRAGAGYLEVPFFATQETKRNRGFGRALLEAIEDVARSLGMPRLLLCSTDDPITKATWQTLGFTFCSDEELKALGVGHKDLLHMDNTVQMHKLVPPARKYSSIVLKHQHWRQRLYFPVKRDVNGVAVSQPAMNGSSAFTDGTIEFNPAKQT